MKFVKVKQKNGVYNITLKFNRNDNFNNEELYKLFNVHGILKPQSYTKNKMLFVFPACPSINKILTSGIDRFTFFKIVLKIADIFYSMIQLHVAICKLNLNTENIFYNGDEIYLIFDPTASVTVSNEQCINAFFQTVCAESIMVNEDNCNKLFFDFVNSRKEFDLAEYLNYINQIFPGIINSLNNLNFRHLDFEVSDSYSSNPEWQNYISNQQNPPIEDEGATVPLKDYYDNSVQPNVFRDANQETAQTSQKVIHNPDDFQHQESEYRWDVSSNNDITGLDDLSLDETVPLDNYNYVGVQEQRNSVGAAYNNHSEYGNQIHYAEFQNRTNSAVPVYETVKDHNAHISNYKESMPIHENSFNSGNTVVLSASPNLNEPKKCLRLQFVNEGKVIDVSKNEFNIGSDPVNCDFSVANPGVSKIHITLFTQNNDFYIRDNGSTNGTSLNGKILIPAYSQKLKNNDRILMADEIIDVQIMEV